MPGKSKSQKRQRPAAEIAAQVNRTKRNKNRQMLKRLAKAKQHGRDKEVQNLTNSLRNL